MNLFQVLPPPSDYSMNLKLFSKFYFLCKGKEYIGAYISFSQTRIYIIYTFLF